MSMLCFFGHLSACIGAGERMEIDLVCMYMLWIDQKCVQSTRHFWWSRADTCRCGADVSLPVDVSVGRCLHMCGLHPCALSGPYRPRGAHGFWPPVVHFPVKSAYLCRKLSDRMSESFTGSERGEAKLLGGESEALFLRSGGAYMIVAKLPSSPTLTRVVWGALIRR